MAEVYIALIHWPALNKKGKIVATAITCIDLHDIARSALTYGVKKFFVVNPLDSGFVRARFGCDVGSGDPDCDTADQNGDGVVDPLDSGFVLARFGPCP